MRGALIEGRTAQAVLGLAEESDLVVIGSRGERAGRSMLFGSVAQAVLDSSACPVGLAHDVLDAQTRSRPSRTRG